MFKVEEEKDIIKLHKKVDIEDILRSNQIEKNSLSRKGRLTKIGSGKLHKVASIPIDVFLSMGEKGVAIMNGDKEELKRFLNQNPQYKTTWGRL